MKKISVLIEFYFILMLPSGCAPSGSRQAELNQSTGQILPVSALAIDTSSDGYTMTVESIRQDSLEGDASPTYFSAEAENFDALFDRADEMLTSRLYLMHARTVIISDSIARSSLNQLTDSLISRSDVRLTLRIAVARGCSPDKLLRTDAISEPIPGLALASLIEQRASEGVVGDCPLFRMIDYQESDMSYALPALKLSEDGHVAPDGSALIENGTLTYIPGGGNNA